MSIKLQTTIVTTRDDWSVARFELLANISRQKNDGFGSRLFAVTTCDREPLEAADPILSILYRGEFDEVWLSTVDTRAGFRQKGYVAMSEFCTVQIDWPKCHSGADGELQQVEVAGDTRPVRVDVSSNLAVAFEGSRGKGRFIAKCSLHRFAACDWYQGRARPSFVDEPAGGTMLREPVAGASVRVYVRNVATWLALLESDEWESLAWNTPDPESRWLLRP